MRDVVGPVLKLRAIRKFSVEKQVGGLHEGAALGKFFDRVTAVAKNALVAVNVADAAGAGGGVGEGGVVTHEAEVGRVCFHLAKVRALMVSFLMGTSYCLPVRLS